MAVRIRNFGGVLQELAPGASLDRDDLRLVFCRTASRLAYLLYVTRGLLRAQLEGSGHRSGAQQREFRASTCLRQHRPMAISQAQPKVYVEADGELVGTLPAEITMVPDAL